MTCPSKVFLLPILSVLTSSFAYSAPPTVSPHRPSPTRVEGSKELDPIVVSCIPERPTAWIGESLKLSAFADDESLTYSWSAKKGAIEHQGREVSWVFDGVQPGPYSAAVEATDSLGNSAICTVSVFVFRRPNDRASQKLNRETRRAFLFQDESEQAGLGLYSYLLLGAPPDDSSRQRYLRAIEAYHELLLPLSTHREFFRPDELNLTYLPLGLTSDTEIPPELSPEWLLEHYDFERARYLLRSLPGSLLRGPYIVSVSVPLSGAGSTPERYLFQDLSRVEPESIVSAWLRVFQNQASQERFWEASRIEEFALRMRTAIAVVARGLPDVVAALPDWIVLERLQ